jgi:hypothetical protein
LTWLLLARFDIWATNRQHLYLGCIMHCWLWLYTLMLLFVWAIEGILLGTVLAAYIGPFLVDGGWFLGLVWRWLRHGSAAARPQMAYDLPQAPPVQE